MTGWRVFTWFSLCATGTVTFLKLVANAIDMAEQTTAAIEQRERRAYELRLREAQAAANKSASKQSRTAAKRVGTVIAVDESS